MPAPLGPSTASTSPAATENSTSKRRCETTARSCNSLMAGGYLASVPVSRRAPSPSTTTAATTTNRMDSATAASASVTRCR